MVAVSASKNKFYKHETPSGVHNPKMIPKEYRSAKKRKRT